MEFNYLEIVSFIIKFIFECFDIHIVKHIIDFEISQTIFPNDTIVHQPSKSEEAFPSKFADADL